MLKHYLLNKELLVKLISIMMTIGVTVATIVFTAKLTGPIPLTVNSIVSQKQNLFTSVGESEIITIPDQAEISVGVKVNQATVVEAQNEANEIINSISDKLQKMGLDKKDIETQNYSIYPEYGSTRQALLEVPGLGSDLIGANFEDETTSERKIIGYSVNANLRVKITDFEKLNEVIDLATAQGANQVGGIQFSLSTAKENELKKQARQEAIADAKQSAEELAKLSGIKLGKVVDASESQGGGYPRPLYAKAEMAMDSSGSVPTSIEPGTTTYTYSVVLSYETY